MYLKPTTVYGSLIPGSEYIRSLVRQGTMSKDAAKRLSWVDFYNSCGDARLTCRHFASIPVPARASPPPTLGEHGGLRPQK